MKPVRILFGLECFGGGVLRHVLDLATHLDRDKFQVFVLTSSLHSDQEAIRGRWILQQKNIQTYFLPIRHRLSPMSDLLLVYRIIKYIKKQKIDIVHAHSSKIGVLFRIAARLCRIPVVYSPHCFYFLAYSGVKQFFFLSVEGILSKITDRIVVSGNEIVPARRVCNNPDKIKVIDNTVHPDSYTLFSRAAMCEELGLPESDVLIGGVGRLVKQKGWETFVRAAVRILQIKQDVSFFIAGDGPDRDDLQSLIDQVGIAEKFRLLGYVQDISKALSCMDLFVSTSKWEGLPYAYLEAELFNKPMFVSNTLDIDHILPSETCFIYPIGNDAELAELLKEYLIRTPLLPAPMGLKSHPGAFELFISRYQRMYGLLARPEI